MDALKKDEVIEELRSRGVTFNPRATAPELRHLLKEARKSDPQKVTPSQLRRELDPTRGLASLGHDALILKCHEMGLEATRKDSKGALLVKLRTYLEGTEDEFDPDSPLTWSCWAGKTPNELAVEQPGFLDWCLVTAREEKTSPMLTKFADWAERARAEGKIPGSSSISGRLPLKLTLPRPKVKPTPVKKEQTFPRGPPKPDWDGRVETLEAFTRAAAAWAQLQAKEESPMDMRDKRKDMDPPDDKS